jgi:hypothetical protein
MSDSETTHVGKSTSGRFAVADLLATLITGCAIGVLMGLSVTPVLSAVLTSILGAIAGAVTTLRFGPRQSAGPQRVTRLPMAIPAACLMAGIALAAPAGIVVRTHKWLEPQRDSALKQTSEENVKASLGVLFGVNASQCDEWLLEARTDVGQLRQDLRQSRNETLMAIERRLSDAKDLREAVEWVCRKEP